MIKQGFILLLAVTASYGLGNGGAYSKKNAFQAQGPSKYASVTAYHSAKPEPQRAPHQSAQPEPQRAPSPYSFAYDAEGSARQESGDESGRVSGSYQVTNEDGSVRVVKYVADENGFRADIDTNEPGTKGDNPADVTLKSAAVQQKPEMYAAPQRHAGKANKMHYEQKPVQFNFGNSGGYSYNYESKLEDGGSSAQSESSDGAGLVTGHYSMSTAGGSRRKVDYSAGKAGFTASVDTNEFGTKTHAPANVHFKSAAPLNGPAAKSFAQAPIQQQKQQQTHQYSSSSFQQEPIQAPSPYAFSYDAQLEDGSSSRQESADASGKVVGSYSLSAADGRKRVIKYEADKEGFRAQVDTNEFGTKSDSPADVTFYSSAPKEAPAAPQRAAPQQTRKGAFNGVKSEFQAPSYASYKGQSSIQYNTAAEEKPVPYAFNYVADLDDGSITRKESADGSGKVVGSYSLSVADGRQRTVDYLADNEGFRATVNTNEFGTKADSPADVQFYSSATFDEPAPYSSPRANVRQASASMYGSTMRTEQQAVESPIFFNMGPAIGAYSYNYEAQLADGGSSARSESSDGSQVKGFYSMAVADGRKRKVDYTADGAGFQASIDTNEFGTKADSPAHVSFMSSAPQTAPAAPAAPVAFKAPATSGSGYMYQAKPVTQQKIEPAQSFQPSPYAFSYEAEATGGSSSRKESADSSGAVTGSYEVRNEDGSVRIVEYIADHNGFRANVKTNEHGTKSDHPADVTLKSDAPLEQSPLKAQFPAPSNTPKSSMVSQKRIEAWSR